MTVSHPAAKKVATSMSDDSNDEDDSHLNRPTQTLIVTILLPTEVVSSVQSQQVLLSGKKREAEVSHL